MIRRLLLLSLLIAAVAYSAAAFYINTWKRQFGPDIGAPLDTLVARHGPYNNQNPIMSEYYWEGIKGSRWVLTVFVKSEGADAGRVEMAFMTLSLGDYFASCPVTATDWTTALLAPMSCSLELKA